MKKILFVILIIILSMSIYSQEQTNVPQNPSINNPLIQNQTQNDIKTAEAEAIREAKSVGTFKWCCIGSVSTMCCSGFGCLGATLVAYLKTPELPVYVYSKSPQYQNIFRRKYESKVKQRKALSAFLGGLGTAVVLTGVSIVLQLSTGLISDIINNL